MNNDTDHSRTRRVWWVAGAAALAVAGLSAYSIGARVTRRTATGGGNETAALAAAGLAPEPTVFRAPGQRSSTWAAHPPTEFAPRMKPIDQLAREFREDPGFHHFAEGARLGDDLEATVAGILALGRLNLDTVDAVQTPKLKKLLPARVRDDTSAKVLAKLSTEQRTRFADSHLMDRLLAER